MLKQKDPKWLLEERNKLYQKLSSDLFKTFNIIHEKSYHYRFWELLTYRFLITFCEDYLAFWNVNCLNDSFLNSPVLCPRDEKDYLRLVASSQGKMPHFVSFESKGLDNIALAVDSNQITWKERLKQQIKAFQHIIKHSGKSFDSILVNDHNPRFWRKYFVSKNESFSIWQLPNLSEQFPSHLKRRKILLAALLESENDLSAYPGIFTSLVLSLPRVYLEGYTRLESKARKLTKGLRVEKLYFSHIPNVMARIMVGLLKEEGSKIIITQHGGGYGETPYATFEAIEKRLCDKFLSWGEHDDEKSESFEPVRLLSLKEDFDRLPKPETTYLFVYFLSLATNRPYLYDQCGITGSRDLLEDFLNAIPSDKHDRVLVRAKVNKLSSFVDYDWGEKFPDVQIDAGQLALVQVYRMAEQVIIDYPFSTSAWECKMLNIPYKVNTKFPLL